MHTEKKHAETYNLFILGKAGILRMSKDVSFKNRDRFIQLGIAIAALRKMRGLSQEKLAEKAGVSRSLISTIEAPNLARGFSLDVFYDIADALEIDPADLINASVFPDLRIPVKRRARSGGTVRSFQCKRRSRSILNGVKRRPSVLSDQRSQFLTELRPLVS